MMRAIRLTVASAVMLVATIGQTQAGLIVVDSINESASPDSASWGATEVGWLYTPTFSYDLAGITTKFGSADARTVTVEVYNAFPGSGGTLLRSAGFTPLANSFAGGEFAPLSLVANDTYFFGFRNVGGLNVNVTSDVGATNLPGGLRFSFANDGSYDLGPETGFTAQPIVQFQTQTNAVPEPASLAIFGLGALGLVTGGIRRRKQKS